MLNSPDYREILRRELETRCARKRGYSLRAFARDLEISPPSLSLILNGRQGLSVSAARRIAERLSLSPHEAGLFCVSVESEHARSAKQRQLARSRLKNYDTTGTTLGLDSFRLMSDWYHFAILELTETSAFQSTPKWIARALGISENTAKAAIARLLRLGLLEARDGVLRQTKGFVATPSGVPSDALRKFHSQILGKAEEALFTQAVDMRDFSAIVMPISRQDLPWAKEQIKIFRRSLMERLEQAQTKDRVYSLSIQLFSLQEEPT